MKAYHFLLPLAAACLCVLPTRAQNVPDDSEVVTTPVTTATQADQQSTIDALTAEVAALKEGKEKAEKAAEKTPVTWNKSKPFMIGFDNVKLTDESLGAEYKSRFGFSMSKRRTYYVGPTFLNMFRFGIDATWMDLTYAQFEKGKGLGGMTDGLPDGGNLDDSYEEFEDRVSLGKHLLSFNLGVGPSVKIAPFTPLNNKILNKLKLTGYFHWLPGYQALLFTGDGVEVTHGALLRNFGIGVNLSFGRIGIGVEHRWGKSKMNNWQFEDEEDEGDYSNVPDNGYDYAEEMTSGSKKITYKHSTTRFYIGIRF